MSRYYDPITHRFINADGYFQSGGGIFDTNMSAYCGNNPVNCYDPFGERYISSTTVRNEDIYERGDSCSYQRYASLKKYNPKPIGTYSGGDIYFVSSKDRYPTTWNNDVVIIDDRNNIDNPSVQIVKSCLITEKEDMYTILNCLSENDKHNPENCSRGADVECMFEEWDYHNYAFKLSYIFGVFGLLKSIQNSSKSVDIDNNDGRKGGENYLWTLIQNRMH